MGDNKQKPPAGNAHQNNKHGMQLFIFSMVFVILFFIVVTFLHPHSSPDYIKSIPEIAAAVASPPPAPSAAATPSAAAPANGGAAEKEPWQSSPEVVAKGQIIYKTNCAMCHGDKGTGDGPAGVALNPRPRNYSDGKWKQGGSMMALFNTVSKGIPGSAMAGYGPILPEADRWAVLQYIRTIGKNITDPSQDEIRAYKEKKK